MTEEHSSSDELGKWMVMSLEEGFHAYDKTSGLTWPPERSTVGVTVSHVWRDGWNAPVEEQQGFWRRWFKAKPHGTERDFRRAHFVWELSVGLAEAIGYLLPRKEKDRAVLIPRDAWVKCDFSWDKATLSGAGFEFAQVRILMPERSALLKNGLYSLHPLPPLDPFEPSEAERTRKGIGNAPETGASQTAPNCPPGRPSNKTVILEAFGSMDKDPNWTQKELTNAILQHVKMRNGLLSEQGLSHKTIMRHVSGLWRDFRSQKA